MAAGRMETMDAFLGEPDRRRIRRELRRLWADPPAFCRPGASPVTDLLHWEVLIDGPDGSPYAGGTFPVDVRFAGGYPMEPPEITFRAKIYHPNVDEQGRLVVDVLRRDGRDAPRLHRLAALHAQPRRRRRGQRRRRRRVRGRPQAVRGDR